MPKKDLSNGFTKASQSQKFIRHRDVKMKEKELRKEAHIQKRMSEGVCVRCRDKAQWRFKYDKYKPLKNVATCQNCKQKCVTKAYHTYCDPCGHKKSVCPGCAKPFEDRDMGEKEGEEDEEGGAMDLANQEEEGNVLEDEEEERELRRIRSEAAMEEAEAVPSSGWVERTDVADEFIKLAGMKYSRERVVGSKEDQELALKVAAFTVFSQSTP